MFKPTRHNLHPEVHHAVVCAMKILFMNDNGRRNEKIVHRHIIEAWTVVETRAADTGRMERIAKHYGLM